MQRGAGRAGLTPDKKRLLAYLLEQEGFAPPRTITPRADRDRAPLSFAQQRLWFLQQLEPESPAYNVPCVFRIDGPFKPEGLERALTEIIRRHEVLRTTFHLEGDQPVQIVMPPQPLHVKVTDLGHLQGEERDQRVCELALEHTRRPFDLERGPLFRAALLRLSENEHIALFTTHHIASDGWSNRIFLHEVAVLYEAFSAGQPSPLPELPVQYADYAVWQRNWLSGEVLQQQLDYWRQRLRGAFPSLNLPTDRPRPAVRSYNGAFQIMRFDPELTAAIKKLARSEGATLFMTLLAGFVLLMHRYSGQDNILVGTPVAGRSRPEVEGLIGFFVNALVIRTDLSGDPTFRELLRRVRVTCLEAFAHQELPFEKLVEELQPRRDLSRTPLFQVTFTMQTLNTSNHGQLKGLSLSQLEGERGTTQYDLSANIVDMGEELAGPLEYDTDIFELHTAVFMNRSYVNIMRHASANPELRVSELVQKSLEAEDSLESIRAKAYEEVFRTPIRGRRKSALAIPATGSA
jgi:hypothetical protein